jgi:peptide/nickel transport system permease protein
VVGLVLSLVVVLAALLAGTVGGSDPFATVGRALTAPSRAHLMGTDNLGRDVFTAVLHGMRTTTKVVLAVTALTSIIGVIVGLLGGYRGGIVDDLLTRVTELVQSVPRFFLALLVLAYLGAGLDKLILLLGLTSWPLLARVVRAQSLSIRHREFVEAARALGASDARIIRRHVLPNVLPAAIVVMALTASRVILLEASLSFLGLGDPSAISLGYLAANAQRFLRVAWWMTVFPGAAIALTVLGINLLSDAVNDALDPLTARSKPSRWRGRRPAGAMGR